MVPIRVTASELVYVHALRFVDVAPSGVQVPGSDHRVDASALTRAVVVAALAELHARGNIELRRDTGRALLGVMRWNDVGVSGAQTPCRAPEPGTLEARLGEAAATEQALASLLRRALSPRLATGSHPLEIVRIGLVRRGLLVNAGEHDHAPDTAELGARAADAVASELADLRCAAPRLWLDLRRIVDGQYRVSDSRHARAFAGPPDRGSGRASSTGQGGRSGPGC